MASPVWEGRWDNRRAKGEEGAGTDTRRPDPSRSKSTSPVYSAPPVGAPLPAVCLGCLPRYARARGAAASPPGGVWGELGGKSSE